jgi:hypothetical protein
MTQLDPSRLPASLNGSRIQIAQAPASPIFATVTTHPFDLIIFDQVGSWETNRREGAGSMRTFGTAIEQ